MERLYGSNVLDDAVADTPLCEPLARLTREHAPLLAQLDDLAQSVHAVISEQGTRHWQLELVDLEIKVEAFMQEWETHYEREETILFPMLSAHIGRSTGLVAVMDFEHDLAKEYLRLFQKAMDRLDLKTIDLQRAIAIAGYAHMAHTILTEHVKKEEQVLFPLAEATLTFAEKAELEERMLMLG